MFSTLPMNPFYAHFHWPMGWPRMPPPVLYVRRRQRKDTKLPAMCIESDEVLIALCALKRPIKKKRTTPIQIPEVSSAMTKTDQSEDHPCKKRKTDASALETQLLALREDVEQRFLRIEKHFAFTAWEEIAAIRAAFAEDKTMQK